MDRKIDREEMFEVMQNMATGRSPGPNGLTIEWFKTFFHLIADDIISIYNNIFQRHEHETTTMKTGYIKLVHKRNEKYFLDTWRGLTLPNVDHRI